MGNAQKIKLSGLCEKSFMLILQLRAASEYGDPETLRKRIHELLDKLQSNGKQAGYSLPEIESAKFAIAAFIDETILASQWSQKETWLNKTLGAELFNRMDAGEEFFNRLETLLKQTQENVELIEVYYYCLALGFKGRYLIFDQEKLRFIKDDVYKQLTLHRGKPAAVLSPHGQRKEEIPEVIKKEVPAWIIAAGAFAVGMLFYIIMLMISNNQLNDAISNLK